MGPTATLDTVRDLIPHRLPRCLCLVLLGLAISGAVLHLGSRGDLFSAELLLPL